MQPAAPLTRSRRLLGAVRRATVRVRVAEAQLSTPLELVGAGLITSGVSQIYVPAGYIVAGFLAIGLGFLLGRPPVDADEAQP